MGKMHRTCLALIRATDKAVQDWDGNWYPKSLLKFIEAHKVYHSKVTPNLQDVVEVIVEMPLWLAEKHGAIMPSQEIMSREFRDGEREVFQPKKIEDIINK